MIAAGVMPGGSTADNARRTMVFACGNALLGDDGVGWRIGREISDNPPRENVFVVCTQQLLPEHAEAVSDADLAVFVDCSAITPAGTVSTTPIEAAGALPAIFTHHLDPASLLKLALEFYGKTPSRSVAITVGGEDFALREVPSGKVAAAIPAALLAVRRVISERDCRAEHEEPPTATGTPGDMPLSDLPSHDFESDGQLS
ncbi:NADH-reducing hydrogenase maturation factor [Acidisarcina polymorpha]|uniref:NADH-reducing hydrogenase maturation factor n=1 Tax=Acidisarcina polymorpha TaxID=2211140 RepID=A0A2Z5G821_9BACT|nr:hydrogenase maturation protease [Acidisarcina polymorpha]AXC15120.1 NADH-reducing hydrogenase maturation factor [Acidisarcina polymorpha]